MCFIRIRRFGIDASKNQSLSVLARGSETLANPVLEYQSL